MPAPKKLDGNTETQVVAMLARGDTHQQILNWLEQEKGITVSLPTIGLIKRRNEEGINFMKSQLVKHETTIAATILEKSRRLIDRQLDKALSVDDELRSLRDRFEAGEITDDAYYRDVEVVLRNRLSVHELTSLSKEHFNQSQVEAGKPTSITETPEQAKQHLSVLLAAIAKNDDKAVLAALFPDD